MIRVNLIPEEFRKPRGRARFAPGRRLPVVAGAAILGLCLLLVVWQSRRLSELDKRIASTQSQIEQLKQSEVAMVDELMKMRANIDSRMQLVLSLDADRDFYVRFLEHTSRSLPGGVWLTAMREGATSSGSAFTIEGRAWSSLGIASFLGELEASELVMGTKLISIRTASKNGTEYLDFGTEVKTKKGSAAQPAQAPQEGAPSAGAPGQ